MKLVKERVVLEVTRACNNRCVFCPEPSETKKIRKNLPLTEFQRRLDELRGDADRFRYIGISGGEPLLHPRIAAIIKSAAEQAEEVVLSTNATLFPSSLITLGRIDNLCLQFNVPSLDPLIYAAITGRNHPDPALTGRLKSNMQELAKLAGRGAVIDIVITCANSSPQSICDVISFALDSGFSARIGLLVPTNPDNLLHSPALSDDSLIDMLTRASASYPPDTWQKLSVRSRSEIASMLTGEHERYVTMDGVVAASLFHAYVR